MALKEIAMSAPKVAVVSAFEAKLQPILAASAAGALRSAGAQVSAWDADVCPNDFPGGDFDLVRIARDWQLPARDLFPRSPTIPSTAPSSACWATSRPPGAATTGAVTAPSMPPTEWQRSRSTPAWCSRTRPSSPPKAPATSPSSTRSSSTPDGTRWASWKRSPTSWAR